MGSGTLSQEALESRYKLLLSWQYSTIDFLGLPNFQDDRPVALEQIYVGMRLSWEPNRKNNLPLATALQRQKHLVVLGDLGSGKSTLVRMMAYSFGRTEPTPLVRLLGSSFVPIPVVLRDYKVRTWTSPADMLRD